MPYNIGCVSWNLARCTIPGINMSKLSFFSKTDICNIYTKITKRAFQHNTQCIIYVLFIYDQVLFKQRQ